MVKIYRLSGKNKASVVKKKKVMSKGDAFCVLGNSLCRRDARKDLRFSTVGGN